MSRENRGAKAKAEAEAEVNVGGDNGGGRGGKGDDSPRLPSMRRRFVRRLAEAMENPCRVRRGATLLLAVSGGADSLALLAGLTAIARKPHRDYRLHVACVHHHLRDEADAEAEAVEHLAAALGLPFHRRDIHPANAPGNLEANARRDRYDALFEIARSVKAEAIVTGQHGTDQIETILLALARGAGLVGLAGMNWRSDLGPVAILRPLLNQSHENCVELCRSIGWTWFEDPSNRDESRSRNLIRSRILPVLREIAPDLETRIHRTTDLLEAAAEHFEAEAARARQEIEKRASELENGVYRRAALCEVSDHMLAAFLRERAIEAGSSPDAISQPMLKKVIRALRDHATHPRCFEFPGGVRLRVTHSLLRVEPAK